MDGLHQFGWTAAHQAAWEALEVSTRPGSVPARVVADFGTSLTVVAPDRMTAELSGKLAHYTARQEAPKVGDWVALAVTDNAAVVEAVVLRANEIARKVTGKKAAKQILATNVDIAFVLLALDGDFSVERLRRFLYQLHVSAVEPVIVLNKADTTDDLAGYIAQLAEFELPIITTVATDGTGVAEIMDRILPGKTAILLGSSGVGKSTLTNMLLGRDAQTIGAVRASDGTGKHTTVHRELFVLPNKGILIDTPGIRELQLWGTEAELDTTYDAIGAIAARCAYSNCRHGSEAGCAIVAALASGELDKKHYANYLKMKAELAVLAEKKGAGMKREKQRQRQSQRQQQGQQQGRQQRQRWQNQERNV